MYNAASATEIESRGVKIFFRIFVAIEKLSIKCKKFQSFLMIYNYSSLMSQYIKWRTGISIFLVF